MGRAMANCTPDHFAYEDYKNFPHEIREDGSCSQLQDDGTCGVHDNLPDVCSLRRTWERHFSDQMSLEEYYELGASACNILIEHFNLADKYKVKITP